MTSVVGSGSVRGRVIEGERKKAGDLPQTRMYHEYCYDTLVTCWQHGLLSRQVRGKKER